MNTKIFFAALAGLMIFSTHAFADGFDGDEIAADHDLLTTEAIDVDIDDLDLTPILPIKPPILFPIACRKLPDLVVSQLPRPEYNPATHGSIIRAVVRNQGGMAAGSFVVRLSIDGGTYNVAVGGLAALTSRTVIFHVPYWVYNPDARYTIKVDATNRVRECNEKNNSKSFFELG